MNGHVFQSTNELKAIWAKTAPGDAVANQHQEICVKPVSR